MPDFSPMPPMGGDMSDPGQGGMDMDGMAMGDGGFGDSMPNAPVMDDTMGYDPNQFDTNFDAGVEANEETDPKKYIQQLTGKLSQSLRKYNQSLPQPDADLDKYVAGMIVKQATDGLSQEDRTEILNKVSDENGEEQPADAQEQMSQGNTGMEMPPMPEGQPMESFDRRPKQRVNELTIQPGQQDDDTQKVQKATKSGGYRRMPFSAPNF